MDTQTIIEEMRGVFARIDLPARKGDIIGAAQDQDVSEDLMSVLQQLPEQKFDTVQDILSSLPLGDMEEQIERSL